MVINVVLSNLFDTHYQLIRAYPAPGRAFRLSVNYLFQSKTAEK
jgi:outer membrane cobalamin receptor